MRDIEPRKPRWWAPLAWLALGAFLGVAGWRAAELFGTPGKTSSAAAGAASAAVDAAADTAGSHAAPLAALAEPRCYLGVVVARETVDVAAETGGLVERLFVRVGDRVEPGQVLAALDTRQLRHQLEIERAVLEGARASVVERQLTRERAAQEHERRSALEGLLSREEAENSRYQLDKAAAELEAAQAELERVKANLARIEDDLERSQIRAPFQGTVAHRYLDSGAVVASGTRVLRLISSAELLVRFAVPPEEVTALPLGTPLRLEIENLGAVLEATVAHRAPEIDAASQMVFVEADLTVAHRAPATRSRGGWPWFRWTWN